MSGGRIWRDPGPSWTRRSRRYWDRVAPTYDRWIAIMERLLLGHGRAWMASRARGDVLEIAVGTGRNLALYPRDVHVTGIDLSPRMLGHARRRAAQLGRHVELRLGDAQRLDLPPDRFDTVVFSLALCSIADDRRAIHEAMRVLRPGGRILLLEHVRSPFLPVRAVQRILDLFTSRLLCDHQLREPLEHLLAEGFLIEEAQRSKLGVVERVQAAKPPRGASNDSRGSAPKSATTREDGKAQGASAPAPSVGDVGAGPGVSS